MKNDVLEALHELKKVMPARPEIDSMMKKATRLVEHPEELVKIYEDRRKSCSNCFMFLHMRDVSGSINLICQVSGNLKNSFESCNEWRCD